jgi:fatty acid desaturase
MSDKHTPHIALTEEQISELGAELDAIRRRVVDDLGAADRDYLYRVIKAQRGFEVAGRGLAYLGFLPPFWLASVAALSLSKILDNMEIGHNVMHGQYDWMRDPAVNSKMFEWDTVCPAEQWRHSHNYMHHTYINIIGKDRDIGYGILRMDQAQKWNPYYLGNPLYAALLMLGFEWGVMLHDLEAERVVAGEKSLAEVKPLALQWWNKAGRQVLKDYVLFPALTGPLFLSTLSANATANVVRNIWAYSIIFCGHFPTGVATFTEAETENESRGRWYLRQMLGSANITGSKLFHVLTGNLSFQIEHHLFPDLPARRYGEIANEVQDLCAKYGLPYNSGRLSRQLGSVYGKIVRLALPSFKRDRPEPGPAITVLPSDEHAAAAA